MPRPSSSSNTKRAFNRLYHGSKQVKSRSATQGGRSMVSSGCMSVISLSFLSCAFSLYYSLSSLISLCPFNFCSLDNSVSLYFSFLLCLILQAAETRPPCGFIVLRKHRLIVDSAGGPTEQPDRRDFGFGRVSMCRSLHGTLHDMLPTMCQYAVGNIK